MPSKKKRNALISPFQSATPEECVFERELAIAAGILLANAPTPGYYGTLDPDVLSSIKRRAGTLPPELPTPPKPTVTGSSVTQK